MGQYSKYKLYYKEEFNGEQWTPVIPYEYYGELIEEYSTDCGYVPPTRTVVEYDSDCSGTTKVTTATTNYQISYDNGQTWVTTSSTSNVTYEYDSDDCTEPTPVGIYDYLTFVAINSGSFNFSGRTTAQTISYSTDNGNTWSSPSRTATVNVNSRDKVMWKGTMNPTTSNNGIGVFSGSTASFNIEGNIMSLLYGDNFSGQTSLNGKTYVFINLFASTNVINAENLALPATTLATGCYEYLFDGCTSLTSVPLLPSTTLADYCYFGMFQGCSSLTTAPLLSSTAMSHSCYAYMFYNCTNLVNAPLLPATTLANYCYQAMFGYCTSLVNAPSLPATTLANNCYNHMFRDCTSLTTSPELLSTRLVSGCYMYMFRNCTNLNYIKMMATNISATNCLNNWVDGVQTVSGTFVKDTNMSSLPTGTSGIPNGWTVQDA